VVEIISISEAHCMRKTSRKRRAEQDGVTRQGARPRVRQKNHPRGARVQGFVSEELRLEFDHWRLDHNCTIDAWLTWEITETLKEKQGPP